MAHVVHAVARSSIHAVFKGGTHLRLCIVEIEHLPEFRYSEDLDFEWEDAERSFWEMFRKALTVASDTSGHEMRWSPRGDRFWWRSPDPDMREGFIKIDYRERGIRPDAWYDIWNPQGDGQMSPCRIRGFITESVALDKLATPISLRRAKARDVYDLWFLSRYGYVDLGALWSEFRHQMEPPVEMETVLDFIMEE